MLPREETRTRLFSPLLPFLRNKFSLPLSLCHSSPFDLSLISVCSAEKTEFGLIALKTKRRSFCWNENKQHLKFKQSLEGTSSSEGDMSLLYSPSFNYTDAEFRKNQEFLDLSHHNHHYHQLEHQHNSSLMRYRSAPSSLFDGLINGTSGHDSAGDGGADNIECEDYQYRSSSSEIDAVFARFMAPSNGSGDSRAHHGLQEFADGPVVKQEEPDSHMNFQTLPAHNLTSENNSASIENSAQSTYCNGMNSMALENSMQASQMDTGNGSNLVRQNSSPAGLFSKLAVNNGFAAMRNMASFRTSNGRSGEGSPSASRLGNQASFTSGQRLLPQISGIGDGGGSNSPDGNCRKRQYMSSFGNDSWSDGSLNGLKKLRDSDSSSMFSGLITLNNQAVNSGNGRVTGSGLTHHLSLPKAAPEMATIEKFLQFQGTIPCKIRAKRGCATHPRSIAERVRRTRISERMRKLQELFPHIDKQTNTADMLDVAVEYIKDLQKQVKTLTDSRAKCTCSSKQKHYANQCA